MTSDNLLYHNRIALLCQKNSHEIKERIEKYFDCFFLDEVQDVAGHDFDLLLKIIPPHIDVLFVGDFYQHTFNTSLDGNKNKALFDDLDKYKMRWTSAGLTVDTSSFLNSHRCSPTVCDYVRENIGIEIHSNRNDITSIEYVSDYENASAIIRNQDIPKFFIRESRKYRCNSINWGDSKGMNDFTDICIILNKDTLDLYNKGKLHYLKAQTRNKLYVAFTRAKGNIFLIPYNLLSEYKIRD